MSLVDQERSLRVPVQTGLKSYFRRSCMDKVTMIDTCKAVYVRPSQYSASGPIIHY